MGNSSVVGEAMNTCGCTGALGFETSAKAIINFHGIEPWNARELVKDNLRRQSELARRSPLHQIPIEDGLRFIGNKARGWFQTKLTREQFAQTCVDLLLARNIPHVGKDREELYQIFDSMDFDGNGSLSLGEWAGGLSVFFKGNTEQCVHAVFNTLDSDRSQTLTKKELQEYLKPFVKAMSPPEADSLRPILLKKATDDIYEEMDLDHHNDISSQEMLEWTKRGNNIIDRLADIIDKEVYQIWLAENHKKITRDRLKGNSSPAASDIESPALQQNAYYNGPGPQDYPYAASPPAGGPQSPGRGWGSDTGSRSPSPPPPYGGPPQSGPGWGGPPSYGPPLQQPPPQGWGGPPGGQQGGGFAGPQLSGPPGDQRWQQQGGHVHPREQWRPDQMQGRMPPPPPPAGQDPFRGGPPLPPPPPMQNGGPRGPGGYGGWNGGGY